MKLRNIFIYNGVKIIKYLVIHFTKEMPDLHIENYKVLLQEIWKGINKWKCIPYSWIGTLNLVKIEVYLN